MKSLKNILLKQISNEEIPKEAMMGKKGGFIGKYYEPFDMEIPEPGTPIILYSQTLNYDFVIFGKTRIPSEKSKSNQEVEYTAITSHTRGSGFIELAKNFTEYFNKE
jgi:hypothetical protein